MNRRHRFAWWLRRRREEIASEVSAELDFHLEMRAQELIRSGIEETEA